MSGLASINTLLTKRQLRLVARVHAGVLDTVVAVRWTLGEGLGIVNPLIRVKADRGDDHAKTSFAIANNRLGSPKALSTAVISAS